MDELLDLINAAAQELLGAAQELEANAEAEAPDIEALKNQLNSMCSTLTHTLKHLQNPSSPLRRLVRMIDGTRVSQAMERLSHYIAEHRATLIRLQIDEAVITRAINALEREAKTGENKLDTPQTLCLEDAIEPIKALRDVVCEVAKATELVSIAATPALLKQIVTGAIGVSTIVLDVTAAVAAGPADPVGWVLFKAVKSVWAGASAVRQSVTEIKGMLKNIREALGQQRAEERQRNLESRRANTRVLSGKNKKQDPPDEKPT